VSKYQDVPEAVRKKKKAFGTDHGALGKLGPLQVHQADGRKSHVRGKARFKDRSVELQAKTGREF
jgi:hypothetical protein